MQLCSYVKLSSFVLKVPAEEYDSIGFGNDLAPTS